MSTLSQHSEIAATETYDLICFSHLRWDFVYQRPQHLLSRFAGHHRVFVVEEPVLRDGEPELLVTKRADNIYIALPNLPHGLDADKTAKVMVSLLDDLLRTYEIKNYITWYYTPMMLAWSEHLRPLAVVYDCMDQLSAFKGAPPELIVREAELFSIADLVFTGGQSLYEAKRDQHSAVYAFPSSIDVPHFAKALAVENDMPDQAEIPHPRIGFVGVIDERLDIGLLREIAGLRPDFQFVMIGPVVKIDEADLPRLANIHYLGGKSYDELPAYIGGWDVAMMPFALNESTRYISPTKTPEYLAAGRPVVSTAIRDVVRPYGENGLVFIAGDAREFAEAIDRALTGNDHERRAKADEFLSGMSWNSTFEAMSDLIGEAISKNRGTSAKSVSYAGEFT